MTKLKYMESPSLLTDSAQVIKVVNEGDKATIFLEETIFYPQGGGSPYDQGTILSDSAEFQVDEVRFVDGEVLHIGKMISDSIQEGDTVQLSVNHERREMIAKLQSGGHLIDMAMREVGKEDLIPTKGFHFPEGPNVEYEGTVAEEERESLKSKLQEVLDRMIEKGYEVKVKLSTKDEATNLCYFVPPNLPENKPIRIVSVWNDEYMPCGAIHVSNIRELKGLLITKIKCKGGSTKVSYSI